MGPDLAQRMVNRAWWDVRRAHYWSFLQATGTLIAPVINVTQYSTAVTLSSALATALTNLTNPVLSLRQFRVQTDGMIYTITDSNPVANVIHLDDTFYGQSNATANCQVYRAYYGYPLLKGLEVTDFMRYKSITDLINNRKFLSVRRTREQTDADDPQRTNQSSPYYLSTFDADANGRPRWEIWPHPISAYIFRVAYQRRGVDMTQAANDVLPDPIPDHLLIEKASYYASKWAEGQAGIIADVPIKVDWGKKAARHNETYKELLREAIAEDSETTSDNWVMTEDNLPAYPLDSAWLQSHDPG